MIINGEKVKGISVAYNTLNLDEKIELITSRFNCEVVKIALSGDFTIQPEHKIYV